MPQRNVNVVNRLNINGAESGLLTDAELREAPLSVEGPLTDAELRASAVPVSGPVTDAQIRATPLPVSGPLTDTQLRAAAVPVSGSFLTDTQLRAAAVPVSTVATLALVLYEDGSVIYVCQAAPGSAVASAVWQVMKVDATAGVVIQYADGDIEFDNVATDLATVKALSYS